VLYSNYPPGSSRCREDSAVQGKTALLLAAIVSTTVDVEVLALMTGGGSVAVASVAVTV